MLDEEDALPEQVDEATLAVGLDGGFFKGGDSSAGDAEDVEEFIPESFSFRVLGGFVLPFARKGHGAVADLIPRQRHVIVVDGFAENVQKLSRS